MNEAHEPIATPATPGLPPAPPRSPGDPILSRKDFERLFAESHSSLWLLAAGLVHVRSDADDVVQEAALQATRRLREFRPGTNFRAWMAQFVRFVAANQNRSRRRDQRRTPIDENGVTAPVARARAGEAWPIDRHGGLVTGQSAFDDKVVRALKEVQPVARACLLLRVVAGLPFKEVATLLDIPEGTAMSHVFRARVALQKTLRSGADGFPEPQTPSKDDPKSESP